MKKGRVAIVYPWPNLDTVPSLCNAALLLSQHGYLVDIFTYVSPEFKTPIFDAHEINVRVSRSDTFLRGLARSHHSERARLRRLGVLFTLLRGCYRATKRWINRSSTLARSIQVWWLHRGSPYRCFVGVDPEGLSQAYFLARFIRVPIVYYSLELLLSNELSNSTEEHLKKREISLSRKAPFIIIQDRERAQLLAEDNQIPIEKFVLVPNAPLGPARQKLSCYWHQQFGLSPDHRIVLHAGSLGKWTGIEEIVDSVRAWPENWVLVVHTRYDGQSSADVERLRSLAIPGRVLFSLKPVFRQEYDALVDGADIGVAFYVPTAGSPYTGRNIQSIGLSSGKIASYLRAGLPVIVNDTASISELVQGEGCGISVREAQDIGKAITQIAQNYEEYSTGACEAFNSHFDFSRSFKEVIGRIDSL